MVAAALLVLLCGLAVGATSIGGVLVVPVLTGLADVGTERAVSASSLGFAFTGAAAWATSPAAAGATTDTSGRGWALAGGAFAGAALGAFTLAWLPGSAVRMAVGLLAIGSGVYALIGRGREATPGSSLRASALLALGLVVGCASAWSGTGGPVVLLPLLALLGYPALQAVDAAQRVQLPVALSATAVNAMAGRLDVLLGIAIGALVLAGWACGRSLARRLPVRRLQQGVALALIAAGLCYLK